MGTFFGDYIVINDSLTTDDFSGTGAIGFSGFATSYDTTIFDPDINSGTDLGIVVVNNSAIYAFSGADSADTNSGGTIGWLTPEGGAVDTLVDISTNLGGLLDIPNVMTQIGTVGEAVPEPSTALLSLAGLFSLITRRRRLI